jgi:hypothetical protein
VAGIIVILVASLLPKAALPLVKGVHELGGGGVMMFGTYLVVQMALLWGIIHFFIAQFGNAYAKTVLVPADPPALRISAPMTHCPMCQSAVPAEQQTFATNCNACGADLSRWRR